MTKRDRIAVVITIFSLPLGIAWFVETPAVGLMVIAPLSIYWAYKFIKNDISFLKMKDE